MNRITSPLTVFTLLFSLLTPCHAAVKVHPVFDDNMVLQRNNPICIWGSGNSGEKVTVSLGSVSQQTSVGTNGTWSVKLPAQSANNTPQTLTVNTLSFKNVLIGDVWILGGQSNMLLKISGTDGDWQNYLKGVTVRILRHPEIQAGGGTLAEDKYFDGGGYSWTAVDPATTNTQNFSAVGLWFAAKINKETNIPIGLMLTAVGGSKIEAWTPLDALEGNPTGEKIIAFRKAHKDAPHDVSGALYNFYIQGLTQLTIGGYFWYQGEANSQQTICDYYEWNMNTLIDETRRRFVNAPSKLPFLIMQVHPWQGYSTKPETSYRAMVREAQTQSHLGRENTGLVVILDTGTGNIHSKNKQAPGVRAGTQALVRWYGKKIDGWRSPFFKSMSREGDKVLVYFDEEGVGLKTTDGAAPGNFHVRENATDKFVLANAKIVNDHIELQSTTVKNIKEVRYASIDEPTVNLVNKYDMPVNQFKASEFGVVSLAPRPGPQNTRLQITSLQQQHNSFTIDGRLLPAQRGAQQTTTAPQLHIGASGKTAVQLR